MRTLLLILLLTMNLKAFPRGSSGVYHMKGIAYSADKNILKNSELTVKIGEKVHKVMTDENGNYDIGVRWMTACRSGSTKLHAKRETDRLNPDYIFISFDGKQIKVKNDWKNYTYWKTEEKEPVKKMDLNFV